jgi:hypothetical protein
MAFLLSVFVIYCSLYVNPWTLAGSAPKQLDQRDSASAILPQLYAETLQTAVPEGILKGINSKQSTRFCRDIYPRAKSLGVSGHVNPIYTASGPSITYGTCTLFQPNNQQAFLRLDLPPPAHLFFC